MKRSRIIANLVIGSDGSYAPSSQLTSFEDRNRFHNLRSEAGLIVIGGNTAKHEPYANSKQPTLIITRSPIDSFDQKIIENENIRIFLNEDQLSVSEIVSHESEKLWIQFQNHKYLLIEGGPSLIIPLIQSNLLDTLYLTRTPKHSSGAKLEKEDISILTHGGTLIDQYFIQEANDFEETAFEEYEFWRGSIN